MLTACVLFPGVPGGMLPARVAVNVMVAEPVEGAAITLTTACPELLVVTLDVEIDIALELLLLMATGTPATGLPPAVAVTVYTLVCERPKRVSCATLPLGPATLISVIPELLRS